MSSAEDLGALNDEQWKRLQELLNKFEEALKSNNQIELGTFLPPAEDTLRLVALPEMIKSLLEDRWRKGRPVGLEDYLEKYPELGSVETVSPKMIFEEFWIRHKYGDKPSLEIYKQRFPKQFTELKRLVEESDAATFMGVDNTSFNSRSSAKRTPRPGDSSTAIPIAGGYRKLEKLGSGNFGVVWKAEAPGGKLVAVKIINWPLDHPAAKRELQSLDLIKRLNHPYLLDLHAFDHIDDRLVIVMNLADGNLHDRLKECKRQNESGIPPRELLRHMREAADALDYLHSQGIQHRDIKPGNILLSSGHVQIGDLGLARILETQQQTGASILGTPPYMPPEAWLGTVHTHSDQYSLAVTYVELRRGKCPFKNANMDGLLATHLQDANGLTPLKEEERKVLLRAGAKSPDERFPTCMAFVEALEEAVLPRQALGFRKIRRIGKGQFGEVWQGEAPGGIPVALKVIPLADQDKAKSELSALELIKSLEHPNLVKIFAFWIEEDELYIAMSLADCSLRDVLRKRREEGERGVPSSELVPYLLQAASAIDYLHQKGVVHRDIKPENILLKDNIIKVADFGVARMLESQQMFTATSTGTIPYMPPEVWHGKVSIHSDQYSLAATYVELRLGHRIFPTDSLARAMQAHLNETPDLKGLDDDEREVIQKALSKDPEARYESCTIFAQTLRDRLQPQQEPILVGGYGTLTPDAVGTGRGGTTEPSLPPVIAPPPPDRTWVWVALIGMLLIVPLVWIAVLNWPRPVPTPPSIQLAEISNQTINAGRGATLSVFVQRTNSNEPIRLKFSPIKDVEFEEQTIPSDQSTALVHIRVADKARPEEHDVTLTATSGDLSNEMHFKLKVMPLATLPRSVNNNTYHVAADTDVVLAGPKDNQQKYYTKIECWLQNDPRQPVRFLLIPVSQPFYIMQDMVTNDQFRIFAEKFPEKITRPWNLGGRAIKHEVWANAANMIFLTTTAGPFPMIAFNGAWSTYAYGKLNYYTYLPHPDDVGSKRGDLPALRVGFLDAHLFAMWMGGDLPTLSEWDQAAGAVKDVPQNGPFLLTMYAGPALDMWYIAGLAHGIAINRLAEGPMPVGSAFWDRSYYGCRDMAGNGLEWTRTLSGVKEVDHSIQTMDDLDRLSSQPKAFYRSQSYLDSEPFRFGGFNASQPIRRESDSYDYLLGFRVVVSPSY